MRRANNATKSPPQAAEKQAVSANAADRCRMLVTAAKLRAARSDADFHYDEEIWREAGTDIDNILKEYSPKSD